MIQGIHHVTAFASDAKQNLDFYTQILGLRLVKKTVNYEASSIYHLYYGDEKGNPGSILTFFPYAGLKKGRHGKGMVNTTTFSIDMKGLDFWMNRLTQKGIKFKTPQERFYNEAVIYLEDEDGLGIEIVFNEQDLRIGYETQEIPQEFAIKGIYNVEIWYDNYNNTAHFLSEYLLHKVITERGNRIRMAVDNTPGKYIDILWNSPAAKGLTGAGTVHHLAFATENYAQLLAFQEQLLMKNIQVTEVKNRTYFESIYFHEPGGVLFEAATTDKGFTIDEPLEDLGKQLMLPSWMENDRKMIEQQLIQL